MTAINTLVKRDSVHLVTDAASYDADRNLVATIPKVALLPHLNAAVACRGPFISVPLFADLLSVNGEPVLQKHWHTTRIRAGDSVEFWSRPMGGSRGTKQVLGIVALVAVAALSLWAGPWVAGAIGGTLGTLAGAATAAAIGCGGELRVDVLRRPA